MKKDRGRPAVRVCFVCLGNICRSPTAAGVMRALVAEAGLGDRIEVASAGTADYHQGEPYDRRAIVAARRRGLDLTGRARRFEAEDFAHFDLVLAMDAENARELVRRAPDAAARAKIRRLLDLHPEAPRGGDVPDPYYGGPHGFDEVLDLCEVACRALLEELRASLDV